MITIIVFVLILMYLPIQHRGPQKSLRINCLNHLKEIGTAYRIWAGDNGDLVPSQQSVANGGWKDLLTNANQGSICWTNYAIIANELGQSTKLVVCSSDGRKAALRICRRIDGRLDNRWQNATITL